MNIDDLIKKVAMLEDENKSNQKTITALTKRLKDVEDSNASFLENVRDSKKEVERLNSKVMQLGQFDAALTQIRVDLTRKLESLEEFRKQHSTSQEKIHQDDIKFINTALADLREENAINLDKRMKSFFEEDSRLVKKVEEMETSFNSNMRLDKSFHQQIESSIEEVRRATKKMDALQNEVTAVSKRQEEIQGKMEVVSNDQRKNENRLNEIQATENQRKMEQANFLDQQSVSQVDRERTWKEWMRQFEEILPRLSSSLQDLNIKQQELTRTKDGFEEITTRFERRVNELTEMHRILEERLRQEWETYKADEQKRWTNYALLSGETQGGFSRQFENMQNRMNVVEDRNKDTQDMLVLMSGELQKSMQGLMKMINNWIETFEDIRGSSTPDSEA